MGKVEEDVLRSLYYKPSSTAGFSGLNCLYKEARKLCPSITVSQVRKWLAGQPAYTLYKQPNRVIRRAATIVAGIQQQYQADLVDMSQLSKWNRGHKFLLTCIDCFSKKAWVVPVKRKESHQVAEAFTTILKDGTPRKLQTDNGTEFRGAPFQSLLRKHNIHWFISRNPDIKCAIANGSTVHWV